MTEDTGTLREALRDALHVLTPTAHRGRERDSWRLDRARWHYQYGDRALARAELKDMNALREAYRWDGKVGNGEIPESSLSDPVGADIPVAASVVCQPPGEADET